MGKGTVAVRFTGDISDLVKAMGEAETKLGAFGKAATAAFVGLGAAAVTSVVGLEHLGGSFDEQFDKIRVQTGETGEALGSLEASFKSVLKSVPASFDNAGSAIAGLNQRLGLTGKPLEDLAGQFINLSRITKTDLAANVDNLTRVFGDWGVVGKDQSATLDKVFRAAQTSGIGIDNLSQSVVQFGAPLRNLGFGLDDSLALLAQFNKVGVNTDTVFAGLKAGVGKLAKAGEDVPETFKRVVAEITKLGPGTEATSLAIKLFGQRAGPDLADAIAGGKFEVGGLLAAISGGKDTINTAAHDTADFSEKWTVFKNRVLVGLAPLAAGVFNAIGTGLDKIGPIADVVQGGISAMFAAFKAGDGDVTSVGFAGVMERIGNAARSVVDWFKANWPSIKHTIAEVFDWFSTDVRPVIETELRLYTDAFAEVVDWVRANWPAISEAIGHVVHVVMRIFEALAAFMAPLWDNIHGIVEGAIRTVGAVISTVLAVINGDWGQAWDGIKAVVSGVWTVIKNVIGGALDALGVILRPLGNLLHSWIVEPLEGIVHFVSGLPGKIANVAAGMFDGIKDAFRSAVNFIIDGWNSLHFTISIPSQHIPGTNLNVGGGEIGFGVPHIPRLAAGGIVRATPGGTLALIGEGGQDEAVIPLPRGGGLAAAQVVNHNTTVEVHVSGSVATEGDLIDAIYQGLLARERRNGPLWRN